MAATSGAETTPLAALCDSHFHLWDTVATPNPNLGTVPSGYTTYLGGRYARDLEPMRLVRRGSSLAPHRLQRRRAATAMHLEQRVRCNMPPSQAGCVHVETCVGQCKDGFRLDPVAETGFVHAQCAAMAVPFKLVVYVNLSEPGAEVAVKTHLAQSERVVGVRMITNFVDAHPEWTYPQVSAPRLGRAQTPRCTTP